MADEWHKPWKEGDGIAVPKDPAPHAELVKRLRDIADTWDNEDAAEAADAIENLTELLAVKQGIIDVVKSTLDDWGITYDETGVDAE